MPNYYEVLGVPRDATDTDIKKAYRTLSLTHHPDRGGDTTKFQEINAAYETLSDPQKREMYNAELNGVRLPPQFSGFPFQHGFPMGGPNIHFAHMGGGPGGGFPAEFGDLNEFIHMMFQGGMQNMARPIPIIRNVKVTISQAYNGISVPVEVERWIMRDPNTRQMEKETIYVPLPAGIDDNEVVVLREKGNVINENTKGDVKVVVQVENDTLFRRQGLDLIYPKTLTLKEALCGFIFSITHLNGKPITFNNTINNSIIKPGSKKVIPGMGMVRDGNTGNLIIDFEVQFPDTLTPEQITSLSTIL